MGLYKVTKTYDHNLGLSACFRQPKANSHCRDPHGYPLSFKLTFSAPKLDENNWVLDFGGLKPVKAWLALTFDHRTILAEDDEALEDFQALYTKHRFEPVLVIPTVGCEGFAKYVYDHVRSWLESEHQVSIQERGLRLESVEVREHGGNSAIYEG